MARMRRSSEQTLEYRIEQAEGEDLTSYLECAPAFGGFIFGSSHIRTIITSVTIILYITKYYYIIKIKI